ncbi:PAS domain-containing methyl-accepting chemotaxis protein [Oceanimonas pelagia]|uniref:PAS domain-containing methyl-accepting chemotaxis protein n=1 Tax=Oceanimonas pelagia TaxID=3028314 RepID=A0AA50KQ06_9GAMM|nr:PAS domain-containing methyl-accepting chemotaxis protein [Oceanimonas pelagia]WMC11594.1 PAS domain-containing methyl-accepting chemotaxis protein [Oceanimonas pelagia]
MRNNQPVTGRNVELPDGINILSTTSPDSRITYVNRAFTEVCGFQPEELIGQPHNMIRHPDMPPQAFAHMWQTLKAGRSWMGLVKNRCKNGDHYWVSAYVSPIVHNGEVVEYQSVRTKPEPARVAAAERLYARLRAGRRLGSRWGRLGLTLRMALLMLPLTLLAGLGTAALFSAAWLPVLLAAGLTGGLCMLTAAVMLSPLRRLAVRARKQADNPLSRLVYTGREDELGQIDFALAMAQAESVALLGRLSDSAQRLGGHSADLLQEMATGQQLTMRQQAETEQVATAINQMAASIQQVASSAQQAATAAEQARQDSRAGQRLVAGTSESIHALDDEIREASRVIRELESHGQSISTILEVIRGIAEQTNLLALNAAIEAARAGEQGRGFAVVADEVRSLAGRTSESTTDIQNMISQLQQGTRLAVSVMERSREQARHCVDHARQAAGALDGIDQRVQEISEMNMCIATAVEQQSAVSEDINRGVDTIRDAAEHQVATGRHNRQRCDRVAELAEGLNELSRQLWLRRT